MKEIIALIGLACTVIGTLLALGVIHPLGGDNATKGVITVRGNPQNDSGTTVTFPEFDSGGNTAKVPDVRGESFEEAEHDLEAAGFVNHTRDETFTNDDSLVGKVVQTGPPDGWDWPKDKQIRIFVGKAFG
jgi:beta-lactam-binding protein with PASTA domain